MNISVALSFLYPWKKSSLAFSTLPSELALPDGWFNIFVCGSLLLVGVAFGLDGGENEGKVRLEFFAVDFSLGNYICC